MGALATHVGDVLGRGEPDVLLQVRDYLGRRSGALQVQGQSPRRVGTEVPKGNDFSFQLAPGHFTDALKPIPAPPSSLASRRRPLPLEEVRMRQRKLGELCRLATVSRPDTCACLAQPAARVGTLQGRGIYRINDLIKTVKKWRRGTILKYASSSLSSEVAPRGDSADSEPRRMRARGKKRDAVARRRWPDGRMRLMGAKPNRGAAD